MLHKNEQAVASMKDSK